MNTIDPDNEIFMGGVDEIANNKEPWKATVVLNITPIEFKLDTGADVTAISPAEYDKINKVELVTNDQILRGPGQEILKVKGKFTAELQWQQKNVREEIYIIENVKKPLLGRAAIENLGILVRLGMVEKRAQKNYCLTYPTFFTGLGKLQGEYRVKLAPGAIPFSISAPRRIPYPLRPKVHDELNRMEQLGVISKISEPTPWCAGIVTVPKVDSRVRICVDLTKLNATVCRERYQLPSVDESLVQLSGAKVFTKLDANSGFWQVPLHSDSRLLTTFLTPFGRYCFNRLHLE